LDFWFKKFCFFSIFFPLFFFSLGRDSLGEKRSKPLFNSQRKALTENRQKKSKTNFIYHVLGRFSARGVQKHHPKAFWGKKTELLMELRKPIVFFMFLNSRYFETPKNVIKK
jgi:hypothetical protein